MLAVRVRRASTERWSGAAGAAAPGVWLLACALACNSGGGDEGGVEEDETSAGSSTGSATEGARTPDEQVPSAVCEDAPRAVQGRFSGTLRGDEKEPDSGGVCGSGGPDRFLRVMVPARADVRVEARGNAFVPRVSLTPAGCALSPRLVCSADGFAALDDVGEGTELVLTIGADPAVFKELVADEVPEGEEDPLGFVVDIGLRSVLATDEVCMPAVLGRCASGSLCMPPRAEDDGWRCTALAGDSCAEPERVSLALEDGAGTLVLDPNLPQSDAHRHSCTGGGTRERVLQLRLPAGLRPQDALRIRSERPEVGLAVRAPGCLGPDELDCGAPHMGGAQVMIEAPASLHAAEVMPYLFVELPEPGVLADPVVLQVRVVLHAPPAGTP